MRLIRFISWPLAVLFVGCSPSTESGLTKQEVQEIASVVTKQTTNHLVGMQREPNGDVTVWTAALREGTNGVGTTFTIRRRHNAWAVESQKQERLDE